MDEHDISRIINYKEKKLPNRWEDFMYLDQNKKNLTKFLRHKIIQYQVNDW